MDFHSLTRRELQAFCKRNKIPANTTNAAMADALSALEIVEGIEEFMQTSQSETTQSSIELQDSLEVTSPYVPPTGGWSTRRRNVSDAEAVSSIMTTARRTTRKTAAKAQVDGMETPAVAAQASRRRVQIAPACLEMDSKLKECMEEEKKDTLMTPAARGVASRRRRAEETEKKVHSTRRSARLAVKSMPMLSRETELSNEELFAKDCEDQEVNQQEVSGITGENVEEDKEKSVLSNNESFANDCEEDQEVNQISGITGADGVENMEEDKEKSELSNNEYKEVNLKEDHHELSGITGADAIEDMEEDKEKSEAVSAKKDITMGEVELRSIQDEETRLDLAAEVQEHNEEICDNGDEDTEMEVEACVDVTKCETEEVALENSQEVVEDIETDAGSEDEAAEFESNSVTEVRVENSKEVVDDIGTNAGSEDEAAEFESKCDDIETDAGSEDEAAEFESKCDDIETDAGSEDEAAEFESKSVTEVRVENSKEVVDDIGTDAGSEDEAAEFESKCDDIETDAGSEDEVAEFESRCETEVTVENSKEVDDDAETDAGSEDEAAEFESKVDAIVVTDDEVEVECEDDDLDLNATLGKLTEMRLEQEVDSGICEAMKTTDTETVQVEGSEETEMELQQGADAAGVSIHEETKKSETETARVEEGEDTEMRLQQEVGLSIDEELKKAETETEAIQVEESEEMSKALMKENSGLAIMEDDAIKAGQDGSENLGRLEEESLRKLMKMYKEKLQISSKSSKNGGNKGIQRSALQEVSENTLIGGNGK
ncbi:glutamic acid-rich protein-like isoform X1 [Salvia divinorum]|uniref:Glutamic acid-rich protein-like isoform X1 n=1 Tax=Salvia divinorum TaxID=28513 RepID=A0ABD1ICM1_SALDI